MSKNTLRVIIDGWLACFSSVLVVWKHSEVLEESWLELDPADLFWVPVSPDAMRLYCDPNMNKLSQPFLAFATGDEAL